MTEGLLKEFPGEVKGIVRSDCLIHGKSWPKAFLSLIKKTGLFFVGYKAINFLLRRATSVVFSLIGRSPKIKSLHALQVLYKIPVVGSKDVNNSQTLERIREWKPDLIFSIYLNQLIKRELIDMPSIGIFNIHPALLPKHRGLFSHFWVLANREKETGVTIHWVDEKFDTGPLLLQKKIKVGPDETMTSLGYKSACVGAGMLVEAIQLLKKGNPPQVPQDNSQATYHSWPLPSDQRYFRKQGGKYGTIFELWEHL
jgi:folate-dependent phosphoribosylglycinamide formyltransferase PurN